MDVTTDEQNIASAAALFNQNPKEFLKVHYESDNNTNVADIARILYDCHPLLDVNQLGKQFGHDPVRDPIWVQILIEYATCFDFHNKSIVQSLRDFLFRFRLPGEAAQIGRIMEAFSGSYFGQNFCAFSKEIDVSMSSKRSRMFRLSRGYYVRDVAVEGSWNSSCCLHCGRVENDEMPLYQCSGCQSVTFCRKCLRRCSQYGHAFVGRIGFGSACANILWNQGALKEGRTIEYDCNGKGLINVKLVTQELVDMAREWSNKDKICLPFADKDAVYVFAYSLIMLTTNLHNPNIKDKMTLQQFLVSNNGINNGDNLPGDFLASCYEDIASEKIDVMA